MTTNFRSQTGFIGKLSDQKSYDSGIVVNTNNNNKVTSIQVNDPIAQAYQDSGEHPQIKVLLNIGLLQLLENWVVMLVLVLL